MHILHISSYFFEVLSLREEVLGPLGAEVFIGLSEEEQGKRHIANVEAPTDKDVNSFAKKNQMLNECYRLRRLQENKAGVM